MSLPECDSLYCKYVSSSELQQASLLYIKSTDTRKTVSIHKNTLFPSEHLSFRNIAVFIVNKVEGHQHPFWSVMLSKVWLLQQQSQPTVQMLPGARILLACAYWAHQCCSLGNTQSCPESQGAKWLQRIVDTAKIAGSQCVLYLWYQCLVSC